MSLYVWEVYEADRAKWELIAVVMGDRPATPLVTTRKGLSDALGTFAREHGEVFGKAVRQVVYENPSIQQEYPAP
jgi:hypothetical protein